MTKVIDLGDPMDVLALIHGVELELAVVTGSGGGQKRLVLCTSCTCMFDPSTGDECNFFPDRFVLVTGSDHDCACHQFPSTVTDSDVGWVVSREMEHAIAGRTYSDVIVKVCITHTRGRFIGQAYKHHDSTHLPDLNSDWICMDLKAGWFHIPHENIREVIRA